MLHPATQLIGSSDESNPLGAERRRTDAAVIGGKHSQAGQPDAPATPSLEQPEHHIREATQPEQQADQRHHGSLARLSPTVPLARSGTARTIKMTSSPLRSVSIATSCSVGGPPDPLVSARAVVQALYRVRIRAVAEAPEIPGFGA